MTASDRRAIAARLRGLIAGQDRGDVSATARRLHVEELSLRMSIDELSPFLTIDVLTAVVREYGADPTWLLTGEYNPAAHRAVLESDTDEIPGAITGLIVRTTTPGSLPVIPLQLARDVAR